MPTKKKSTPRERVIAESKQHPLAKSVPPKITQNGEAQPKPRHNQD
jgi:hypothetical protein